MRNFSHGRSQRQFHDNEEHVVGEILEDIECLKIDDEGSDCYDDLNDDTFGGGADEPWDPTETFREAENERIAPRGPRELVKCELFDLPELEPIRQPRQRRVRRDQQKTQNPNSDSNQANSVKQRTSKSPKSRSQRTDGPEEVTRKSSFQDDLESYRLLGMFAINPTFVNLVAQGEATTNRRWRVSQRTLERHMSGVTRTPENVEKELFLNDQAFDQILRIHLTQTCKDPRLQNYKGKWNTRHMKNPQNATTQPSSEPNEEAVPPTVDKKPDVNPNRFGKTSSASVRYGRKLIRLNDISTAKSGPVSKEQQIRDAIECGYEALYMLDDIEEEIDQCPMNHVAALDKMQKDREGKLNELYSSLTTGEVCIEDIMMLNKGRLLMIKLGCKLSIETKLQLTCSLVRCTPVFESICAEVDKVLENVPSAVPLIALLSSSYSLKPLVAFDRESDSEEEAEGADIHQLLASTNSYTKSFLFIVEALTMTGHLFLLTSEAGTRETALQRCFNILVRGHQLSKMCETLLSSRGGVIFMNVLLDRRRLNPIAVDKSVLDLVVHYTLEVSERINTHGEEWKSLASTIMNMMS
ncbi:uncharacterized protein BXIN_2532 [Babesia sp. Xinjiang]|uniref:uncharacterized protein n=1 Tax=Babesia sp. Xinjiang TaxID=462227 RepID=UPI000A2386E3|nr:uncharacterized protein BXIN_2532 [Babesia sp. Xinjiang]ORM41398.1 hypothetical protein BXIN_2532 [Babesia sp. Xinjiang]